MRKALSLLPLTGLLIAVTPDRAVLAGDQTPLDFGHLSLPRPLTDADFRAADPARAALGQLLFYDPLLSGNRNIACASCHHPDMATADGVSLGLGEGATGLGVHRRLPDNAKVKRRVPRHAPALFNLGAHEFSHLFHDGRVSIDDSEPTGFDTPAEEFLPSGLQSLLAAQVLFPLLAEVEMAGRVEDNEVAGAARRRADYGWREIEQRLRATPDYAAPVLAAFPQLESLAQLSIVHVANALDDFINHEWRADSSPFDDYLRGDTSALKADALAGMARFYGDAGCSSCHGGALQTDHAFHALMLPPFGPGRTRQFESLGRDAGRLNETDQLSDAYRFRTPSLRNVAETAPYGHNGSYASLRSIIRHHADPVVALSQWDRNQLILARHADLDAADFMVWEDVREMRRYRQHVDLLPMPLDDDAIDELIAFLHSLSDKSSLEPRLGIPSSVPSGLPLDVR